MGWRKITAALAAAGLVAACASQESPSESGPPSSSPSAHGSYAECLNEHGVPAAPGPNTGPPAGVDRAAWDQALKSCASLAPGPG
ncbi:hypothetical protein [Mycolicibacterium monacense]|uniref:hypothetical protein n=1 Tax=Mycolicibacterium monacense TaxID=85693 RepID=UPI0009F3AB32|nr:hypothetical protein [Mycolicibacterium monacense]MDA4100791.1 hypothetical protein [Mycolicibacterium monacense DSM 44395]ORB22023.1 hypothetical protein BST34_07875 [Mycolicibacterium monacense DSM 44395]QHP88270.1 hypothetical protein EWR22_24560 [Mycolicibacterium monacense DSM 44395]